MTVREIIRQLQACNQDKEVVFVPEKGNSYERICYIFEEREKVVIG